MDDTYPDSLPPFTKPKNNWVDYLHQWVTRFENDSHFDKGAIPVLTVKEYDKQYKSVDLVELYRLLLE